MELFQLILYHTPIQLCCGDVTGLLLDLHFQHFKLAHKYNSQYLRTRKEAFPPFLPLYEAYSCTWEGHVEATCNCPAFCFSYFTSLAPTLLWVELISHFLCD